MRCEKVIDMTMNLFRKRSSRGSWNLEVRNRELHNPYLYIRSANMIVR